jgi:membrane associated rhomboid family serine protease
MFLHGGWMHLIGNMLFLWVFGDNVEDEMGHARFAGFYLLAGLAAAALQIASDPLSSIPMVGASGAIAGVLGGYLLLFPRARIDVLFIFIVIFKVFPIPAWIVLGLWFGLQLLGGFNTPSDQGGVAYWAHAGGFVAGIALMLPLWRSRGGRGYWNRTHGVPPHPETQYTRSRIPAVVRRR